MHWCVTYLVVTSDELWTADVNECTRGTDRCHHHATCYNTEGSYTCSCNPGYTGSGRSCIGKCTNHNSSNILHSLSNRGYFHNSLAKCSMAWMEIKKYSAVLLVSVQSVSYIFTSSLHFIIKSLYPGAITIPGYEITMETVAIYAYFVTKISEHSRVGMKINYVLSNDSLAKIQRVADFHFFFSLDLLVYGIVSIMSYSIYEQNRTPRCS